MHTHIVKCGGTTFFHILKKLFTDGFYRDSTLLFYQYTARQFLEILDNCPNMKAYSSHKISLDLPFDTPGVDIRAIVFVRDPVDRFLSHYFMHSNRKSSSLKSAPMAEELDLAGYIKYALVEKNLESYIDGQVRFLMQRADPEALAQIKTLIEKEQLLLFPLSKFDDACLILEKMFPAEFSDCAYSRKNISKKNEVVSQEERELIRSHVGTLDQELLKMAHEFLDVKLNELLGSGESIRSARADFVQRCQDLKISEEKTRYDLGKPKKPLVWLMQRLQILKAGLIASDKNRSKNG